MKIEAITIHDKEKDVYFSFIKQFPAVCSQAKTVEESMQNVKKYFSPYLKKIAQEAPQIEQNEMLEY